jgi:hypothetical protein
MAVNTHEDVAFRPDDQVVTHSQLTAFTNGVGPERDSACRIICDGLLFC